MNNPSTKCPGSLFGAHRFEARYSEFSKVPDGMKMDCATPQLLMASRTINCKYEGDVCVRCGEMRKFSQEEKS